MSLAEVGDEAALGRFAWKDENAERAGLHCLRLAGEAEATGLGLRVVAHGALGLQHRLHVLGEADGTALRRLERPRVQDVAARQTSFAFMFGG